MSMPQNPVGPADEMAVHHRMLYEAYREQGFTSTQSLYLLAVMMTSTPGNLPPADFEPDDGSGN